MTVFEMMGLMATVALAIPVILIVLFKLAWYRSFPALLLYYLILCSYNILLLQYLDAGSSAVSYHALINNFLNAPLALFFLTYFTSTQIARRNMLFIISAFVFLEIVSIVAFGFSAKAAQITTLPGLVLTLGFALYFFIPQLKLTIVHQKGIGKALILSCIFFTTLGYGYTFSVLNFVDPRFKGDARLIFFLVSIMSAISISVGIIMEQRKIRQLEELKTTREELKALYGEEEPKENASFGAVTLNFDKEQWN
jgi:hypothetical protein